MRDAYTQIAAGLRRLTPAHVVAEATAERFEGLPADTSKGQVLAAFKRAATALSIPPRLRDAIDVLMSWSQEQDWQDDSRPIVWPSNRVLQDELGLSLRQVQYTLRDLVTANLVVPVDSPTGRRWGRRHPVTQRIIEAYGYDLSPLAVRHAEFCEVAECTRLTRQEHAQLRRRLTIARKGIQQIAQVAIEHGLAGRDWAKWAGEAVRAAQDLTMEQDASGLAFVVESLEQERREGEGILNEAFLSDETARSHEPLCTPITTTTEPSADKSAYRNPARQKPSSSAGRAPSSDDSERGKASSLEDLKITPTVVLAVAPGLRAYVTTDRPAWADIVEAASWARGDLGINRSAWVEACQVMGRYEAAGAVAVISAKGSEIRSPGGYLRGMTARARDGDLHLGKSFYGLLEGSGADG